MKDRSTVTLMTLIHLIQCKEWLSAMFGFDKPVKRFKYLSKIAYSAINNLVDFMKSVHPELYEESAEISDSIMILAELSDTNQERVFTLIKELSEQEKQAKEVA